MQRIAPGDLSAETRIDPTSEIGPRDLVASEWIVQLTDGATGSVSSIESIDEMLDRDPVDFTVIAGLGSPGSVLLRGRSVSEADVREALSFSSDIESFSANALVQGQATPNELSVQPELLPGLARVGASDAWDVSRGSSTTVVGVVDSGIDPTHRDLFLNIWINQGEILQTLFEGDPDVVGDELVDIDGDGLITFYDLNNLKVVDTFDVTDDAFVSSEIVVASTGVTATKAELTTATPFATGENASFVRDLNSNGRIDAIDLLEDADWADGKDTDNNGFFDDFFGVNFRAGAGDPFDDNNPSDELGHGTHVAGTIGAIGNNDTGVVGVNWRTSLMSLRILDNNNQGDSGAAIRAVNYARQMRERFRTNDIGRVTEGAEVRVLNNSWGQPAGFEISLEAAIRDSGDAGILFVAASGNGNILGNGVDNDRTPFYPASYDSPNVIAVAASDSQDRLASFSNFGVESVDVLAPGVGIRSTLPGGSDGSANGTSMASPHVAGAAALIWSAFPTATVDEVRQAIVSTVDPVTRGDEIVSTGGRLNVGKAINANVFAPAARVTQKATIIDPTTLSSHTFTEFTVEYSHRDGIDLATIGNDDLIVTRQWGPAVELPVRLSSKTPISEGVSATYIVDAPGSGSFSSVLPVAIENALPIPTVFTNSTDVLIDSGPANTITSQIVVDNISNRVLNLVVSLDIDHTYDADLTATLIAPDGTRALLFSSIGGSADNFTGTVLDDSAATSITAGSAPFTGSFRPQASITPLAAAGANGTWTLEISDGANLDGGSLNNWSLSILETSTTSSQILVRDVSETVADFTVSVDIEHASVGDLAATLIAPDGSRAVLFANVGGTADNFTGTIFDDTAATSISVGSAPFSDTFTPQENLAPLGASGPNGIWTLELENGSLLESGQLLEWSLNFSGSWDPLDFGDYVVSTVADNVSSRQGAKTESREIGSFNVRIKDDSVIYVDTFSDETGSGSLRDAIIAANAASPAARTIILDSGTYTIDIPAEVDPASTFGASLDALGIDNPGGWSNATTGDFDVEGQITIIGSTNDDTVIDAQGLDRVFKVYPTASLNLTRLTVQGGVSPATQGGGGILSLGELDLQQVIARENIALGADGGPSIFGGAIAAWGGTTSLNESWLTENQADFGGGIYYGGDATGEVQRSTLSDNQGGGLYSFSSEDVSVENSTFSANSGGYGAIANGILNNFWRANFSSFSPSLSADGRYVAFESRASNLVSGDNNGSSDVFVYDRTTGTIERVSLSDAGVEGNSTSFIPSLSADGRYVTFSSIANNLVPGDNNGTFDIFVYDRTTRTIERVSVNDAGVEGNNVSDLPSLSADGRYVTFSSNASNLVPGDNNGAYDVFVYDRTTGTIERVSLSDAGVEGNDGSFSPVLSADGRYVTFGSNASNLVPGDNNSSFDPFVYDRTTGTIERVSLSDAGVEGNNVSRTPALSADGRYVTFESDASNLVPGDNNGTFDIFVYDRTTGTIERVSVGDTGAEGNSSSFSSALSADGRYVTFRSLSSNLVPGDNNGVSDIFVYDRTTGTIEPITYRAPRSVVNVDHSTIAFSVEVSTNAAIIGDVNVRDSLFVANEVSTDVDSRTASSPGTNVLSADTGSDLVAPLQRLGFLPPLHPLIAGNPAIDAANPSADGTLDQLGKIRVRADYGAVEATTASVRGIVYVDRNQNGLLDADEPGISGVQVAVTGTTQFTATSSADNPQTPLISEEGVLKIDGLVPEEYQFAVQTDTGWSVSIPPLTMIRNQSLTGNGKSNSASLSADGRYVSFESFSSNLVPGDNNNQEDIFVYDRTTGTIDRVSVNDAGVDANSFSNSPSLSDDGRYVTFSSDASNLVLGDNNGRKDIFIAFNPLATPGMTRDLQAGEIYTELNFGLVPDPGTISGRVFEDVVANGVYNEGEPVLDNSVTVFLDFNGDQLLDEGEPSVTTDTDGNYEFLDIDAFQSYEVAVQTPVGFEQVAPSVNDDFVWDIFLPAGGTISDRDFAFREVTSTGQSSASAVSGRLYDDKNGNGVFDDGIDVPLANREVFLDATNFGVRDTNEPRDLTNDQGLYSITGLSSRSVAVTTTLDETLVHVSPLGSDFSLEKFPLFDTVTPFANPQAIAVGKFNADDFQDVAVVLGQGNLLSIRLNDGSGGFLPDEIDIELGEGGTGPTSLVVGQFDADPRLDVAITANFSSNVVVLLNFDVASKTFVSTATVPVGQEPIDLVKGQFGGNAATDLVVVNKGDSSVSGDETLQVLTNNGSGVFTAGPAIPTGGNDSVSIVKGDFTGDASLDVAVVHASPLTTESPLGGVTILSGDGAGGLTLEQGYYEVGAFPIDSVKADFDDDGRADLAVANFSSNSISILRGQADGTFRVQTAILGTASGAFDIAVADIDNDGDVDVIASNLIDRNISIFRNIGIDPNTSDHDTRDVRFEPLENIGLGQFALAQRMPLVVANFDNDTSGPRGAGTIDIVTVPRLTDTLHVLTNRLVNGTRRVKLTGTNSISELDFIIQPALLPPSFDPIADPSPIDEDDGQQMVTLTGIAKGRVTSDLDFSVVSSKTGLIANPTISHNPGGSTAVLTFSPVANANGVADDRVAVITVTLTDDGANQTFGDADDTTIVRSFTVTVQPVNDPPEFTLPATLAVDEDAGPKSIANFVTGISPGGGSDESGQTLSAFVITTDNSFFTSPPLIDPQGRLTFTTVDDVSGSVTVNVSLSDNGGRGNGGSDKTDRAFVISILPVNDAPSITIGGSQTAQEGAGLQTVPGFASGFDSGGGTDEDSQTIGDFVVSSDNPSLFSVQPGIAINGTLTYAPAAVADGVAIVTVQVRDSGGTARLGVDKSPAQTFTITVTPIPDTTAPLPVITTDQPSLTNNSTFDVSIDFDEIVTGFTKTDVSAPGATVAVPFHEGNGRYRVAITTASDGPVSIDVGPGLVTDAAGNANTAATGLTITVDSTVSVPVVSTAEPNPTTNDSFDVSIDFGEVVTGFTASDLTLINATASNLRDDGGGRYRVTVNANTDGQVALVVPQGAAKDLAGNDTPASATMIVDVDTTPPTPSLRSLVGSATNQFSFDVEVEFGEGVTGFDSTDLTITGATAATATDLGGGRYRVNVTAGGNGLVTISLPAGVATDTAGRVNLAATTLNITIDSEGFGAAISSAEPSPTGNATFDVLVDFGRPVTGFAATDLQVTNGSAGPVTPQSNGRFLVAITAGGGGEVQIGVPAAVVLDDTGRENLPSPTFSIRIDQTAPLPLITTSTASPTRNNQFDVLIDFGESVVGFDVADLRVDGGSAGAMRSFAGGLFLVPIHSSGDGTVTVSIDGGVATDIVSNPNLAAAPLSVLVDQTAPQVTLGSVEPNPTSNSAFTVTIDFGEPVTGFSAGDLSVVNGSASGLIDNGAGQYSVNVTATADGPVTLVSPAGAGLDAAGNASLSSATLVIVVDTVSPAPTISSIGNSATRPPNFTVEVDFGESVSGFGAGDLTLSSGTVESVTDRGDGRFMVALTGLAEGAFTLSLGASAAVDDAGNPSVAAVDLSETIEIVNPDSIILEGSGNTFFLTQPNSQLDGIQLIDIRGSGDNTLMLDADRIRTAFTGGEILVVSDSGDVVVFDDDWDFEQAFLSAGQLVRRFVHSGAVLNLTGPDNFTNPTSVFDVNASGSVTSVDASQVINELSRRLFSESSTSPVGAIRDIDSVDLTKFRFYDVSRDGRVTALDALRVINQLARQSVSSGEGLEGEQVGYDLTGHVGVGPDLSWQRPGGADLDPGGLARTGPGLRPTGSSTSGRVSASAVATRGDTDDAGPADNSNPQPSLSATLVDSALQTLWLEQ